MIATVSSPGRSRSAASIDGSKEYWAARDGEDVVSSLEEQARRYQRSLRASVQWRKVQRNLRMAHGLWYPGAPDSFNFETRELANGKLGVAPNFFRTYLTQVLTMATGDRISFKARAENTDVKSLILARLGPKIADDYVSHRHGIKFLKRAAWNSLWGESGFIYAPWNRGKGKPVVGEGIDENGEPAPPILEGDFEFHNPTIFDVIFDFSRREWENVKWVIIRTQTSKYDLAAEFPDQADKILSCQRERQYELSYWWNLQPLDYGSDLIYRYDFYHLPTPGLPGGRHTAYIPGTLLLDEHMPYQVLPVFRCAHGEFALNAFGYSFANDLQALQEMANNILSAIATNLAANANGHIWQNSSDDHIKARTYENGLKVLRSNTKPEAINFSSLAPESWRAFDLVRSAMGALSGVSDSKLGAPPANLRSARSVQVTIAQSFEAVSEFAGSYRDMAEDFATHLIKTVWQYGLGKRQVIVGAEDAQYLAQYDPQDLASIDRIVVEAMDPVTNSIAGREAEAETLLNTPGMLRNMSDYVTVRQTGNADVMIRSERAELLLIQEENEALLRGEAVEVQPAQNHSLHLKEQITVLLGSLRNCRDEKIRRAVLSHATLHVQMILTLGGDPNWAVIMAALGITVMPPPAPPGTPGAPPGGPGGAPPPPMMLGQGGGGPPQGPVAPKQAAAPPGGGGGSEPFPVGGQGA